MSQKRDSFLPAPRQRGGVAAGAKGGAYLSTREQFALDRAMAHLAENGIKPVFTVQEFADYFGHTQRKVQSDTERGYLPLMPRRDPNRRELKLINMVAWYARSFLAAERSLEQQTFN